MTPSEGQVFSQDVFCSEATERDGVEFPPLPEVGIDGKTVAIDPQDIIPVF